MPSSANHHSPIAWWPETGQAIAKDTTSRPVTTPPTAAARSRTPAAIAVPTRAKKSPRLASSANTGTGALGSAGAGSKAIDATIASGHPMPRMAAQQSESWAGSSASERGDAFDRRRTGAGSG
jgi:hypothetical protein